LVLWRWYLLLLLWHYGLNIFVLVRRDRLPILRLVSLLHRCSIILVARRRLVSGHGLRVEIAGPGIGIVRRVYFIFVLRLLLSRNKFLLTHQDLLCPSSGALKRTM